LRRGLVHGGPLAGFPAGRSHPTLPTAEINQLWRQVDRSLSAPEMVESTSRLLADLTGMAGVVTLPRLNHVNLRRIEFLPLSDRRVLVILVLHEREVQQRVIRVERDYSAMTLQQAANYLNLHFAGGSLQHIRDQLLLTMAQDRAAMDQLMETVLEVASKTFAEPEEASADCLVLGEANLLSSEHLVTLDRARELFETLRHKQEILHLGVGRDLFGGDVARRGNDLGDGLVRGSAAVHGARRTRR